jgi:acetyl-CoA carboxylase biotin carboxyl carrier protein
MKPSEIKELLDFISKSGLEEVNIETQAFKIAVKRSGTAAATPAVTTVSAPAPLPVSALVPVATATTPTEAIPAAESSNNYITIKSPMIGTFYRTPNPDSPPFVNVGDEIKKGKVLCIIEAMKLFNEIESEVSGKIVKVLVENATPVEYDQPLFLVEPA